MLSLSEYIRNKSSLVFVYNLPDNISVDEVSRLFSPYGHIQSVGLVMDGEYKSFLGMSLVKMEPYGDISHIRKLNGTLVKGKRIRLKWE